MGGLGDGMMAAHGGGGESYMGGPGMAGGMPGGMVGGMAGGAMGGMTRSEGAGGEYMGGQDMGAQNGHEGGAGYMGKRTYIPHEHFNLRSLYSMIRPRRQILGGGGDGGDSVIFVHPGGSQSPVGPNVRGESPLAGLVPGAGIRSSPSAAESPVAQGNQQGNAFVKSGLSGLGSLNNNLGAGNAGQDQGFGGAMGNHGIPSGLAGLGGLGGSMGGAMGGQEGGAAMSGGVGGVGGMNMNDDATSGIPGAAMQDPTGGAMGGAETSANTHDEGGFPSDANAMNMGALQGGGAYGDEAGHQDGQDQMNYQRSMFPSQTYASFNRKHNHKDNVEQEEDLDNSTERDVKSTIMRDDDDEEVRDEDSHERVHKDFIPRPEDYGY